MEPIHLRKKREAFFKVCEQQAPIQKFFLPKSREQSVDLYIKRLDLVNRPIGGNKYYKLKYNLECAHKQGAQMLITFGGAYSNHILAVAQAGDLMQWPTLGIIRGEELGENILKTLSNNSILKAASQMGMRFEFISRQNYRFKNTCDFLSVLKKKHPKAYILPEGGDNLKAIEGCQEILNKTDHIYDYVAVSMGTGSTFSGMLKSLSYRQCLLGFTALKGASFLENKVSRYGLEKKYKIINDYHFGGYAKVSDELVNFINSFKECNTIPLDPVYTSKMLYGISDMIQKGAFARQTRLLAIHTGGLQGIPAMNERLIKTNRTLII